MWWKYQTKDSMFSDTEEALHSYSKNTDSKLVIADV